MCGFMTCATRTLGWIVVGKNSPTIEKLLGGNQVQSYIPHGLYII